MGQEDVKVFVDTSAFVAYFNKGDANHQDAVAIWTRLATGGWRLYTSNYVMAECVTVLRSRVGHGAALHFGEAMMRSRLVQMLRPSPLQDEMALDIFRRYGEHRFSFFDCSSFALMRDLGLSKAFAFDNDFLVAGLDVLRL